MSRKCRAGCGLGKVRGLKERLSVCGVPQGGQTLLWDSASQEKDEKKVSQSHSTLKMVFALHVAKPHLILGIPYGALSAAQSQTRVQSQE